MPERTADQKAPPAISAADDQSPNSYRSEPQQLQIHDQRWWSTMMMVLHLVLTMQAIIGRNRDDNDSDGWS